MFTIRPIARACIAGAALSFGVIGCQSEQRPEFIPSTAQIMDSGNGKIHYTASDDGTVYVYDQPANKLVWSGKVLKGEAVDVDPIKNQVMANGAIVSLKTLNNGNRNDVYFVAAPIMPVAPAASNNPPQGFNNNPGNNYNGVTVTPSVTVQPNNGQPANSVTVHSGLNVAPATQPSPTVAGPNPAPRRPDTSIITPWDNIPSLAGSYDS